MLISVEVRDEGSEVVNEGRNTELTDGVAELLIPNEGLSI